MSHKSLTSKSVKERLCSLFSERVIYYIWRHRDKGDGVCGLNLLFVPITDWCLQSAPYFLCTENEERKRFYLIGCTHWSKKKITLFLDQWLHHGICSISFQIKARKRLNMNAFLMSTRQNNVRSFVVMLPLTKRTNRYE